MSDLEIKPYVPPEWKTISNEALCALAQAGSGHAMDVLIWRNEAFLAERACKVWNRSFMYICPESLCTATDFHIVLKNVNYIMHGGNQNTMHDATHDKF